MCLKITRNTPYNKYRIRYRLLEEIVAGNGVKEYYSPYQSTRWENNQLSVSEELKLTVSKLSVCGERIVSNGIHVFVNLADAIAFYQYKRDKRPKHGQFD